MKKNIKNILYGGDGDKVIEYKQLQTFFSIVIVGYFGVKIIYSLFFKYYPQKYYYNNVQITTNENEHKNQITDNIIIRSFMPGLWNNEMTDFITMIVIIFIIYIFTNASNKMIVTQSQSINMSFLFGYIIGLGYPPIYTNFKNFVQNSSSSYTIGKYILLIFLIALIINIIIINYTQSEKLGSIYKTNYILYITIFILLVFGLIGTRKLSQNYSTVTYFNNDGDNCSFSKNGVIQTSGDSVNITIPFLSFLLILLFSYEPQEVGIRNYYLLLYGILLGIIVSGISFFGIEYFLTKTPQKECNDANECSIKKMPIPVEESNVLDINVEDEGDNNTYPQNDIKYIDQNLKSNIQLSLEKSHISTFNVILFIILIILCIYLGYYYMSN